MYKRQVLGRRKIIDLSVYIRILLEEVIPHLKMCIRDSPLAHLAGDDSFRTFPEIDLKLLREDSFTLISRETRMRDMIDRAFEEAGFRPRILFESVSTRTIVNIDVYKRQSYSSQREKARVKKLSCSVACLGFTKGRCP